MPRHGRIAALDVGDRRIGVAVSDPLQLLARPVCVIDRRDVASDVLAVRECLRREEAAGLVVGLPLLPSGDRGEQALKVEAFVHALAEEMNMTIDLWDESYTTLEAERRQREQGARRHRRAGAGIDARAAAVILEEWLRARGRPSLSTEPTAEGSA